MFQFRKGSMCLKDSRDLHKDISFSDRWSVVSSLVRHILGKSISPPYSSIYIHPQFWSQLFKKWINRVGVGQKEKKKLIIYFLHFQGYCQNWGSLEEYFPTSQFNRDAVYQSDLDQRSGQGGAIKAYGSRSLEPVLQAETDRWGKRDAEAVCIELGCINLLNFVTENVIPH